MIGFNAGVLLALNTMISLISEVQDKYSCTDKSAVATEVCDAFRSLLSQEIDAVEKK